MKTYCFKLYNSKRNRKLKRQINAAGLIYNHCIALHKRYYKLYGKHLKKYDLEKHLTKLKNSKKFSYLREIGSQAVQDIADRIEQAYKLFYENRKKKRKSSPPNFKKVRKYKSFTLKQAGWKLNEDLGIIKIGRQNYRYFQSRRIEGKIKTVTIKRDPIGDIYIYIVTDFREEQIMGRTGKSVGYDFGLKKFLTASDGKDIESPLFFVKNSKLIKKKNKNLSRKQEKSNNRKKARIELARAYKKTANQRKDFHFKTALKICEEYAVVCLEDLNLEEMKKLYGRKVSDLGFYSFVQKLKYEAIKFGTRIILIDRWYASRQICSECGYKNSEVKNLRIRKWECPECGAKHDRDRNASINILKVGASTLRGNEVRPEQSGICC
ncbi:MAG: transposase [Synergistaceae bacterium]|nr:transposase [Synergistaceae bacterium]MBR0078772.1 transposase [Synergistaceae bacterium]